MSVVGFDFGNENCFVAVARQGGIEVVTNEYTYRQTPSVVSFGGKKRFIGEAGKQCITTQPKNTLWSFKHFLGRKYNDPFVQQELKRAFYKSVELPDGSIGFQVEYNKETKVFTTQQIVAMLFTQLKGTAEMNLKIKVTDCVVSVPSFFTDSQRRALLDAAQIAGLNVLRLFNETTATALFYGFYKTDLPADTDPKRNVVFVDIGESSVQVAVVGFSKSDLTVLAVASDPYLGGRTFDFKLLDHFAAQFKTTYKIDVYSNPKAFIRLRTECEKLKKVMSAITNEVPLNIECLMEDKDVKGKMSRAEFEELCKDLLERVAVPCRKVLADSGLTPADIYAVEIVGGSSRIPAVKSVISEVFGSKEISTTLNLDEAVSRGCALLCASLSPVFRVRDFGVTDITPYPIGVSWKEGSSTEERAVFSERNQIPSTKLVTLLRSEPFEVTAQYQQGTVPTSELTVGTFAVEKLSPNADGTPVKVKAKVRVNPNGIFNVEGAYREDEESAAPATTAESSTPTPMDTSNASPPPLNVNSATEAEEAAAEAASADATGTASMDTSKSAAAATAAAAKKAKIVKTNLPFTAKYSFSLSPAQLLEATETENQMIMSDKHEKEREDARNAVEEYVYDMRDKVIDRYNDFVTEEVKQSLQKELDATESWLYDEGEEQNKKVYVKKLEDLKKISDPFVKRWQEAQERPAAVEALRQSIVSFRKIVNQYASGDERYAHLEGSEVDKVAKACEAKDNWINEKVAAQDKLRPTDDPAVLVSLINMERESLEALANPILNKPKPKITPPAPTADSTANPAPMNTDQSTTPEPMKTD